MTRDRRNRWLAAAVGWTILMIIGSSIPSSSRTVPLFAYDKIFHLIEYAIFSILWGGYLRLALGIRGWRAALIAILVGTTCGALDELYQGQVGRSTDVKDWIADTAGAVLGQGVFVGLARRLEKKKDMPAPE
ncbi:MAG: VanZ family protein [Gemmatimonadetes bacterium]|nr:VanZ family protein [Gemmatimonadota bacterium]